MARKIIWSPHAAQSLEDICTFIERDTFRYAKLFAQWIIAAIDLISEYPESGRIVPEYSRSDLLEKILGNYRIFYRLTQDVIEIVIITHGSRVLKL